MLLQVSLFYAVATAYTEQEEMEQQRILQMVVSYFYTDSKSATEGAISLGDLAVTP